ncbi:MAG: hypothetical protein JWM47_1939 [Acidimicrobiales bacterium]|nr:hypothetical protein [Acidimicrobiales bacterium]
MSFDLDVFVDGTRLASAMDNKLLEVRVDLSHNAPAEATLRFRDEGFDFAQTLKLGQKISLRFPEDGEVFAGAITAFDAEVRGAVAAELLVTAHDASLALAQVEVIETFVATTVGGVIAKICSGTELSPSVGAEVANLQVEYLMKTGNALELLDELARLAAATWWVGGTVLHVEAGFAPRAKVERALPDTLGSLKVHTTGSHPTKVRVRSWQPGEAQAAEGLPSPAPPTRSTFAAKATGKGEITAARASAISGDPTKLGTALMETIQSSTVSVRGECQPLSTLTPGATLVVKEAGVLDGPYPLSRVVHVQRGGNGVVTTFEGGTFARPGISGLLPRSAARPTGSLGAHHELLFAKVTNINDPDKQGRVKVNFLGLTKTEESAWARVASLGAGPDRGAIFLPEVNDDVIVGFERGDIRHPVVLGGIYSNSSKQPLITNDGNKVGTRRLQSRLGHHLEFGDGPGDDKEHLLLSLAGGQHKLRIGKDAILLEGPGTIPLTIKNGQASIVLSDGKVTIKGTDIVLQATNGLTMEGTTVKGTAKGQMALESKGTLAVKATATATVEATAILALKGAMVQIN